MATNMIKSKIIFVLMLFQYPYVKSAQSGFTTTKLSPQPLWNSTHTDKLRQDLLLNYDKFARPSQHFNATQVRLGMSIKHIEVNELKSSLTVYCWLRLVWNDEKLKWNPEEYGNLSVLHLAEHEVWQPDIYLYNGATTTAINHFGNTHCLAYPSGEILWVPPAQFTVLCSLNLRYWPFDTQKCYLKFGSWTYSGDQLDITNYNNNSEVELELLIDNSEWKITKAEQKIVSTYYECCQEPYPDFTVYLTLERISPSYSSIIVTPAFVVIILTMLNFWLPPQAGEKIVINGTAALIICLFMLYFTQKLPAMGTHTPLIVLFYTSSLYIVSFSMLGSVVVITLSRTKHSNTLPWIVKQTLSGKLGKYLGLGVYIQQTKMTSHRVTAEEMRDHQVTDFDDGNSSEEHHIIRPSSSTKPCMQQDWVLLAAAIDRISFIFYTLLFSILAIVYAL
ncbi:nicotinic acetylcholine receptor alpha 10 subunit isoform X1 [Leptinotarsa decemlineata]|uniref:nicotinic acetylcholine receptor alpha 10 subunit isoform X1 n=2 Tax=Leptinotarsa decemlineata TaxID=7539 RepID=UPI000C253D53|nr:acetylcholine receptor subunit alpha-type acr-16-like isoform X1 [Leptinotarsa decemlineata]